MMEIEKVIAAKLSALETTVLTDTMCSTVVLAAPTLSIEECYDLIFLKQDELQPAEVELMERLHRYGRAIGIKDASTALFNQMKGKNGFTPALEYLKQCSGDFKLNVTQTSGGGFSFNIQMPHDIGNKKTAEVSKT